MRWAASESQREGVLSSSVHCLRTISVTLAEGFVQIIETLVIGVIHYYVISMMRATLKRGNRHTDRDGKGMSDFVYP